MFAKAFHVGREIQSLEDGLVSVSDPVVVWTRPDRRLQNTREARRTGG